MCQPKCLYCGRFISDKDLNNKNAQSRMLYSYSIEPEPDYEEFWHENCKLLSDEKSKTKVTGK